MPQNAPGDKGKPAFSRKVPLPKGAGGGAKGGTSFPPPSGQQGPQGGQGAGRALWNRPLPGVPGVGEGLRLGEEAQQTVVDGVGQGPVPGGQGVKSGKVGARRERTQDGLSAYLNGSAVQKSRSNRFESSYLLCKEKDGFTIVVWYESKANIAEKTELCALLVIKNVYVLK